MYVGKAYVGWIYLVSGMRHGLGEILKIGDCSMLGSHLKLQDMNCIKNKRISSVSETRGLTKSQNPDVDPHCGTEVHD